MDGWKKKRVVWGDGMERFSRDGMKVGVEDRLHEKKRENNGLG